MVAGDALHVIAPGADIHRATLDGDATRGSSWGRRASGSTLSSSVWYRPRPESAGNSLCGEPALPLQVQTHIRGERSVSPASTPRPPLYVGMWADRYLHGKVANHAFAGSQMYSL